MADRVRSADLLVNTALSSPEAIEGLRSNPAETLRRLALEATRTLPYPTSHPLNAIWLIVISSFALVMVGSALVLGLSVFHVSADPAKQLTKSDTILTVFTTVVGFLAGLLSPSPTGKQDPSNA